MKSRMMLVLLIVPLVAVGMLVQVLLSPDEGRGPAKTTAPLRIALDLWPGYLPAVVAAEKGIFAKNGVAVELKINKEVPQTVADFRNGDVDGIFGVFSDMIILLTEGVPSKVVHVSDFSQSGDVIVGKPEFASLADLKGRTVSFEKVNSFSHIYVLKALEAHGLSEKTVRFEIVPPQNVLTALEQGRIDAGHTWQPTTSQALAKGYRILSKAGDFPGIITDTLSFSTKAIAERPDDIQAVVTSLWEGRAYVDAHREESLAIGAKAFSMSTDELASGLSEVLQPDRQATLSAMTRSESPYSLYASGEFIIQFLLSRGQLQKIPNLDDVIDARFAKVPN
ncbi:MAG: ABC transporter substrate-binding protein [Alphaproteobacteria bacterium]